MIFFNSKCFWISHIFKLIIFNHNNHFGDQFKEIFDNYKIIEFNKFNTNKEYKESNIAATLLKIQERKTAKGNSYAIIKLTDLTSVFELFIFSDILELNRNILVEGNSLIITLSKNITDDNNRFKRLNVKKITSLKDIFNKPISEIEFKTQDLNKINEISNFIKKDGTTEVKINIKDGDKKLIFKLKNKRLVDRKSVNTLKKQDILTTIH